MAAFDALHKFAARDRDASMALYSDENAATLLAPGPSHEILVRHDAEGPHCGLVPLGAPCDWVTTAGLRWNLDGGALAFGDLVSTSNLVPRDGGRGESVVSVACAAPLVWTIARRGDS
jgi:thiamine pyrophosphokinase